MSRKLKCTVKHFVARSAKPKPDLSRMRPSDEGLAVESFDPAVELSYGGLFLRQRSDPNSARQASVKTPELLIRLLRQAGELWPAIIVHAACRRPEDEGGIDEPIFSWNEAVKEAGVVSEVRNQLVGQAL